MRLNGRFGRRLAKLENALKPNLVELSARAGEFLRLHAAGRLSEEQAAKARRLLEILEIARKRRDRR